MGRGLSKYQIEILCVVLANRIAIEKSDDKFLKRDLQCFGVPWRWRLPDEPRARASQQSPSARASTSRALLALERRGLLLRQNIWSGVPGIGRARENAGEPHNKTTHVWLTEAGIDLAKKYTEARKPKLTKRK